MFRVFRDFKWFVKQQWYKYVIVLVSSLSLAYLTTLPPKVMGEFIDKITYKTLIKSDVYYVFIIMVALALGIYMLSLLYNYYLGNLFHKIFYEIKIRFLQNVFLQDGTFFETYYPGDLIARATGDTWAVSNVSTNMLFHLIDTIAMIILSLILMLRIKIDLTLLSIIPLPIIVIVVMKIRPKISQNWRKVRAENSRLNNLVMESVTNVKLVRGFVREQEDEQRLRESAEKAYKIERKSVLLRSVIGPTFRVVTLMSQGIALIYGAYLIINQRLSIGQLITFNLYLGMFARPLFRLGNQITIISQSGVAYDRVNEVLNAEPVLKDIPSAKTLKDIDQIEFRDVSFKYPGDKDYIIKDINLTIPKGMTLGIVGKTGSGKTTLVRQLLRQFPITKGKIVINNKDIDQFTKDSIRRNIAYVPQEHMLFSRTVLENIQLGLSENSVYDIEEVIKMADFEKDLPFLQDGLNTIVGEAGVTLSGGQKQRLSIARALLKNSEVLILDDSLSAVDGMTEANILRNLKKYRKGKTNIIVAHRLTAVEDADLIICLDKGRIVEQGTHEELMANKQWYYEQYIVQQMEAEQNE